MRILVILILPFILIKGLSAQEKLKNILPVKDGKVTYTNIVKVDSVSKSELYKRAKRWIAYTSYSVKLDIDDELVGIGNIQYYNKTDFWQIPFTIKIQFKDCRYKYEISDFAVMEFAERDNPSAFKKYSIDSQRYKKEFYESIDTSVNNIIESLEKVMKTTVDNNW